MSFNCLRATVVDYSQCKSSRPTVSQFRIQSGNKRKDGGDGIISLANEVGNKFTTEPFPKPMTEQLQFTNYIINGRVTQDTQIPVPKKL